jgi:hypothetical protein
VQGRAERPKTTTEGAIQPVRYLRADVARASAGYNRAGGENMPKYVVEREIPGVGQMPPAQLAAISKKSREVLESMGPQIQWVESYVTGDKAYCVYIAPNEEAIREHARRGGFPANRISEIKTMIDPTTAETAGQTQSAG